MEKICNCDIAWGEINQSVILITGANGMLPSYLALALLYKTANDPTFSAQIIAMVRNKDKLEPFFNEYLDKPYFTILEGDVCNPLQYAGHIDYIIHGASLASPHLYGKMPIQTMMPNVLGTYNLLEVARKCKAKGFLFLSSGEVYGQLSSGDEVTEETLGFVDQLDLRSCYAEGKRAGETMCRLWQYQYGIPAKIARISHTYGPTMQLGNDRRVFSEFVTNILKGQDIVMKSDGEAVRTFCYLSDATTAFLKILLHGEAGEAYNVAGDDYISIRQLAETLVEIFPEKKLKVVLQARNDYDYLPSKQLGESARVNNQKLKSLGWAPEISLVEGFRRTILSFENMGRLLDFDF